MAKKILILLLYVLIFTVSKGLGQIKDPKKVVMQKTTKRINQNVNQGVDKGLNEIEELFKKKPKKKESKNKIPEVKNKKDTIKPSVQNTNFQVYSDFDFIPNEEVLVLEDFEDEPIGLLPANWVTKAKGSIISMQDFPYKWLKMESNGDYESKYLQNLPTEFSIEMDVICLDNVGINATGLSFGFIKNTQLPSNKIQKEFSTYFTIHPGKKQTSLVSIDENKEERNKSSKEQLKFIENSGKINKIYIWRQRSRLRVYIDNEKIWDILDAFQEGIAYKMVIQQDFSCDNCGIAMSNIVFSKGRPNVYTKLVNEGKYITRGILFETNSDRIKPESYGVLKEVAQTMIDTPALKIKAIVHTDSENGTNAKTSLELSLKRALMVKKIFVEEFKIDATRIETDGLGDSKPLESNHTPKGKANNRRIEFIKQ